MDSILFLAADPTDAVQSRLGEEMREIRENLRRAKNRDFQVRGTAFCFAQETWAKIVF